MIYSGTILTEKSTPIPGALLNFYLPGGTRIDHSVAANAAGNWSIDGDTDGGLLDPGNTVEFAAPGYYSYQITAGNLPQVFNVTLVQKLNKGAFLLMGAAAAGLAALLLWSSKGPRRRSRPPNLKRLRKRYLGAADGAAKSKPLPRWVLPAAGIGLGAVLIYKFFNKPDQKAADSAQLPSAATDQLSVLKSEGAIPMITQSDAESFSAAIVQATDDCGTDEQAIYNVFYQLFSDADFWFLVKVFGVRQIKSCFGGNYFGNTPYNLTQIITEELDDSEKAHLNQILVSHGITYQF